MDLIYCQNNGFKLNQPQDFKSFKYVLSGFEKGQYPLVDGIAPAQDDHVWIDQTIVTQFSTGPDWNENFNLMVSKAKKYGWIHDETEAIKAHVVWVNKKTEYENILVESKQPYTVIRLNRPNKMNALTVSFLKELKNAIREANEDPDCRAILITGEGRGFCAGQDLNERKNLKQAPDLGASLTENYNPLISEIVESPKPIVCAVNGVAAGAGVGIVLAADIVVAAENAKFILSFSKIGLGPDAGLSSTLPKLVGQARAKAMMMLAEPINANQAAEFGMIWKVYDPEELQDQAENIVRELANKPVLSMEHIKKALLQSSIHSLDEQLKLEAELQYRAGLSQDYQKSVAAFFEEKRNKI